MQAVTVNPSRKAFFGLLPGEVDAVLSNIGCPAYRGSQIRDWVYQKYVADPARMSNLSKIDRQKLAERFDFATGNIVRRQDSADGTRKLLINWPDGANAETVMIPDGARRTACVSSQVGCPVGCKFCASGLEGVKGNLTAAQIVEQIIRLNGLLRPDEERITNVVFMGMGEPLANYANLMQAIRVLHDPGCLNI